MKQDLKDRPFKLPWLPLALLLWFGLPLVCKCSFPLFFFFTHLRPTRTLHFSAKKITSPPEPEKMDLHSNSVPLTYYSSLPQTSWLAKKWSAIWVHFLLRRRRKKEALHCYTFNFFKSHLNHQYRSRLFTARGSGFRENFRLAVKAVIWKLHGLITPLIIYKVRAVSTVCAVTWFLFRWKEQYAEDLIKLRPRDEVSEIFGWWSCCLYSGGTLRKISKHGALKYRVCFIHEQ
jgi:hypothetical protein